MASVTRSVHPQSGVLWGPLAQIAPDVGIKFDGDEEPMALAFVDPDNETHIFLFTEDGRKGLVKQLTGGIIVAGNGGVPVQ